MEDLEARVARLEAEITDMKAVLMIAYGEGLFIGPLAGGVIIAASRAGMLSADTVREVLDRLQLRIEEQRGSAPAWARAFDHAAARAEASLRSLPPAPPEPG